MFADTAGGLSMFDTVTLGALISMLKHHSHGEYGDERSVRFDFGALAPMKVASYRGWYEHIGLGFGEGSPPRVRELLVELEGAIGKTFDGYKGGHYIMRGDTPVWAANSGRTSSTAIVGVGLESHLLTLLTEYVP